MSAARSPWRSPPAPGADPCPSGAAPQAYTIQPGDTLWAIAGRTLQGSPTDAEIDAGWRSLYARNAGVVGPDPDLVRPGQQLLVCR